MASLNTILTLENPVFKTYLYYSTLLGLKMLLMSVLTARQRFRTKTFASPEDTTMGGKVRVEEKVERVRRAHLNDLENIPVFVFVSGIYILTNPAAGLAINLIRAFSIARFAHTLVYAVVVVPQPARALSWGVAYGITWYMGISSLLSLL